jgi:choline dehydrogenase-like flavoprotein
VRVKLAGFDKIIVGGGSAGVVMAARLAEHPGCRVLLVEAGPGPRIHALPAALNGPDLGRALAVPGYRWRDLRAVFTAQQRPRSFLCGRGLGGSSVINGQLAIWPAPGDMERWPVPDAPGTLWRRADVLRALARLEDDLDFPYRAHHGRGGPVPISRVPMADWGPVSSALWEAAAAAGLGVADDLNDPASTADMAPCTWNRRAGRRVTSSEAYLEPARDWPNLTVLADTLVTRIKFARGRAVGVDYVSSLGAGSAHADEVVLCAGAIYSPAVLLRSGVGPARELRPLGIPVVADLPGVGRGLRDHPAVRIDVQAHGGDGPPPPGRPAESRPGGVGHCIRRADPVTGCQIVPMEPGSRDPTGWLSVSLMRPTSTGMVRLATADPAADPVVDLGMLGTDDDLRRLGVGVRAAAALLRDRAFGRVGAPWPDGLDDATLSAALPGICAPQYHASGTCRMGARDDPAVVVDECGRVCGIPGLRVADASVIPGQIDVPPYLTVLVIAERIAASIKSQPR